jgi:hypothetical protein
VHLIASLNLAVTVLAAPDPGSGAPPGSDKFLTAAGWVKWGAGLACVVGLLGVAIGMAIAHRRGSQGEHAGAFGMVAIASVICGVAAGLVTALGA